MSGITLSASVRQNLLSLQSTADLLSTTQNRLATGKKVNSALDNPTNFFTASSLDARSSDINNLLDGIGNGVQILQAANTGITSLQKLVDSAKSVANQALQTQVGYSQKSTVSATIAGATAANLLGTGTDTTVTGTAINNDNTGTAAAITGATKLAGTAGASSDNLASNIAVTDTITVNGKTIAFYNSAASGSAGSAANTTYLDLATATVGNVLSTIDSITGGSGSAVSGGKLTVHTGTAAPLALGGSGLAKLGLTAATTPLTTPLSGKTLQIASTGGGTATNITFGTGNGQVSTLNQLNTALASNNLQASLDSSGNLSITTTNDAASSTIGAITATGTPFASLTAAAPVADPTAQATRASLVNQYNNIVNQITTTASDASFNGVNLLNGDTLKLVFNETGKSTLSISGVNFNPTGLGLSTLTANTDFIDNQSTNKVLTSLNNASTTLRSQASAFGSNLSIVQIRQDFSKSLINVLQTGSSNLTLADTNEEAANSQALSTRQSIAVSALSLANQSQQGVLQLLR
ncbi:flagellar protein [Bradyrhizobium sp. U87765 SZCCT0131]|uniref:flagellin N-terminal helical domain-containing protein n=1 Tax=unclassified Bradyrhizobium TaxID=2631580 RepID=UPI001BA4EAAF|nr:MULTISPECIES: flagellin [unclassified Bradyrhizobium]MBR1219741.1 flagellar protein [Bradyrhizobium sp. U87765 SZCCT0131]MBR1262392.1 flagellar protein [Bradyrhizobium sp. U87765 SZCCT0134]MBR1308425.1 flagellar protein [Bradyrhizobium sp. U87765 SZCCT0110]MBR1318174.1 flagellar protein [Bradyrhizobium sp. U87765 SZCCT0109]MBR1351877.1 flagellar protein [Bradyrhizobium sp. U87765 SZCCT0048]